MSPVVENMDCEKEEVENAGKKCQKVIDFFLLIPVNVVNIVIFTDKDVDDDHAGIHDEHEEQKERFVQVIQLDEGGQRKNAGENKF